MVKAVDGISFTLNPGEVMGLVGNPAPAKASPVSRCWGWWMRRGASSRVPSS
ncbi:hypothetical protein ACFQU7_21745 [Pseudoroseomonas wenyumeiae]